MSGYLGSIGFGYPAAIGAWAATGGERPIIAVTGDGGFGQYMAEILTAVKHEMNITHVLINNGQLGKISKEQRAGAWDVWQTELHNPDFSEYAELCGALGIRVTDAARARRRRSSERSPTTARRWSRSSPTRSSSDDPARTGCRRAFGETRDELHRVAEQVVAPARKPDNEIALRVRRAVSEHRRSSSEGAGLQVTVDGAEIVVSKGGEERRERARVGGAARREFIGEELFPGGLPATTRGSELDPVGRRAARRASTRVADEALERFRGGLAGADDASEINLWPEHFDLAIEAGAEAAGSGPGYGVSPGDEHHPEPYSYVGPWVAPPEGELWRATGFTGAELGYEELRGPVTRYPRRLSSSSAAAWRLPADPQSGFA